MYFIDGDHVLLTSPRKAEILTFDFFIWTFTAFHCSPILTCSTGQSPFPGATRPRILTRTYLKHPKNREALFFS